ncbi:hypothetical protein GCM10023196_037620 [Actinoallomurus vinaceus]|uniref:Helix-turn-helix domain-containing protein n=1 Tax=Actinoallomurus vinaceus TaxID=1080074 RepID=A0ABP8U9F7_9ACTN
MTNPTEEDEIWVTRDVATYFRVNPKTVNRWVKVRKLKPAFVTPTGMFRFRKSQIVQGGES